MSGAGSGILSENRGLNCIFTNLEWLARTTRQYLEREKARSPKWASLVGSNSTGFEPVENTSALGFPSLALEGRSGPLLLHLSSSSSWNFIHYRNGAILSQW